MILYHNADIADIESILKDGLLPMAVTGNDKWGSGRRAKNSTDCIYLFSPKASQNTFPNYDVALVEVDAEDAVENEMVANDTHRNDYTEYTVSAVSPDRIKRVLIPKMFQPRLTDLPESVLERITWCGFAAEIYDHSEHDPDSSVPYRFVSVYAPISDELLTTFAATAPILSADQCNFFRGRKANLEMIDIYRPRYIFS